LIPIHIDGSQNLLISEGPDDKFRNSLEVKIIRFVGNLFQVYFLLLLSLLLSDAISDALNDVIGGFILGRFLNLSEGAYASG
jgi:hypothetical protein